MESPRAIFGKHRLILGAMEGGFPRPPDRLTWRGRKMTERWQQWMPFHIDRFRGSPDVQAMHPVARLGYIMLLASCWQTPDCALSTDPMGLSIASSLGDELWTIHGPRILRKFVEVDGKLRNEVIFKEWNEAKRIYQSRSASARRTNSVRSPSRSPSRQAYTHTLTGTDDPDVAKKYF